MERRYHSKLAAAFIRGRLGPDDTDDETTIARGVAAGLRLHKFKREPPLPRVRAVLGALHGIRPQSLLDIGSGRGTFLWPLLSDLPELSVTSIEVSERRASDVSAVRRGGFSNLHVVRGDGRHLPFRGAVFDVVSLLEVLEHLPNPERALGECVRVARRFVVVSVPSKADDNPEHIHLFDNDQLVSLLSSAGARRVRFLSVLNHRIALASV